jgi:hypothetical protein
VIHHTVQFPLLPRLHVFVLQPHRGDRPPFRFDQFVLLEAIRVAPDHVRRLEVLEYRELPLSGSQEKQSRGRSVELTDKGGISPSALELGNLALVVRFELRNSSFLSGLQCGNLFAPRGFRDREILARRSVSFLDGFLAGCPQNSVIVDTQKAVE